MDGPPQMGKLHGFFRSPVTGPGAAPSSLTPEARAERERVATERLAAALAAVAERDRVRFERILGWRPIE